jgi:preprotein translocase SecE subunit
MARETRRQRRDARRAEGDQSSAGIGRPPRLRTAEAGAPAPDSGSRFDATPAPILGQRATARRWFTFIFIRESWGELKKVEWPNRAQVVQGTVVVIVACAIVGVFLYGADQAIRPLVKHVFLGQ